MAYTHVFERATTIINDPWVSQDIKILQRFGTPPVLDPATGSQPDTRPGFRYFGLNQETEGALFGGVYNVWHTRYPGYNLDTITMFNVGGNGDSYVGPYIRNARVYEFAVALRPEGTNDVSDAVFETAYRRADLDFWALYMGGARPLEAGLYVVSSGKRGNSGFTGLKVVDSRGGIKQHSISTDKLCLDAAYDPFIFIEIDPETGESIAAPPRTFRSTVRRTDSMEGYQQRTGTSLYAWVSMLKHRGNA